MKRRTFLDLAASTALTLAPARAAFAARPGGRPVTLARLRAAPGRIVPVDAKAARWKQLRLERTWEDNLCRARLHNPGNRPVRVHEIVLFSLTHDLPADTRLYGESFQMLTQTGGTLGAPVNLGYDEVKHYKMPQAAGLRHAVTGLITLTPPSGQPIAIAWSSCRRFNGRFYLRDGVLEGVLDAEGLEIGPGETWQLEELFFATGPAREPLLAQLAGRINENHPPLKFSKPPTGWCSWYCFGPRVTAQQVTANLDFIAKQVPALRYVQIDDGYQPAMGDWLDTGPAFGGDIKGVLQQIKKRGFEPAIWVAPFVAEAGSKVFQQHPDWFVKGKEGEYAGKPLPANTVTFGGWRRGPWYALDGTHPEVLAHLEKLFKTMREEWGCTYFKLDANFWGAMHGGQHHDPKATRMEAYRRGMQAILRGTGPGFILGCNHPIWGSFGLIHGSRSSGDVKRTWPVFKKITRQNLSRNWQNGRLWWNDSDAVVLSGDLPEEEYRFHATAVFASGGMILSGDDLTQLPPARLAMLRKLLPPTARAAEFEDETLRVGRQALPDGTALCLFNDEDQPRTLTVRLDQPSDVTDFWTGSSLGKKEGQLEVTLPPHSARLLTCRASRGV
jgi:alpha-galactosidase